MKKTLLAVFAALILCSAGAAEINAPDGFRGVKWGDPPSALGVRDKVEENSSLSTYIKKGDNMSFGGAQVKEIEYTFVRDRFFAAAAITVKNRRNCGELKDALIAEYGAPQLDEEEKAVWTCDVVTIYYKYDPGRAQREDTAEAVIISNETRGMLKEAGE